MNVRREYELKRFRHSIISKVKFLLQTWQCQSAIEFLNWLESRTSHLFGESCPGHSTTGEAGSATHALPSRATKRYGRTQLERCKDKGRTSDRVHAIKRVIITVTTIKQALMITVIAVTCGWKDARSCRCMRAKPRRVGKWTIFFRCHKAWLTFGLVF